METASKNIFAASTICLILFLAGLFSTCDHIKGKFGAVPEYHNPLINPFYGPSAGNPYGNYAIPAGAGLEDMSNPDHVIGTGTPENCTAEAFVYAVSQRGKIIFNTGGRQAVIRLTAPAKVFNDRPNVVIDGNGLAALSGCGGAIYNDGNTMTLSVLGTRIENNRTTTFGSAIFFVSNDYTGNIVIDRSVIRNNIGGSWYPVYPQISMHAGTPISVNQSIIE